MLALKLQAAGWKPWLDEWHLVPGEAFQYGLAAALNGCSVCAILVGRWGLGDWGREELLVAHSRAVRDPDFRLIPILLPGVSDPFTYTDLPPFLAQRTWIDFRNGLDQAGPFDALVNALRGKPPVPNEPSSSDSDECPYLGLETFDEASAKFFFGRDRELQRLLERLKTTRFLAVFGPSGSGKSSLVRAGLIPRLKTGSLAGSELWTSRVFRPGSRPLSSLALHFAKLFPEKGAVEEILDRLLDDPRALHLLVGLALVDSPDRRVVWVIDQFEEVFTLCNDEKERTAFLENLLYASSIPDGQCIVLLTMRADFLAKCAAWPGLAERIAAQQFLVSPMAPDMHRLVIEEPARRVGLEFESGLVETILLDVGDAPGALPLLEYALTELWKRRRGNRLTARDYHESGGVQGALAEKAEKIFDEFSPNEQEILRRIMLRLTHLGEGTEDTRRRAAMEELITKPDEGDAVQRVVRVLADARLLTTT